MIKTILFLILLLLSIYSCQRNNKLPEPKTRAPWNPDTTLVGSSSPWELKYYITPNDTSHALKVEYTNELGGKHIAYAMVIWENKKTRELRLTAPWIDKAITIYVGNLVDSDPTVVPKSEVAYMDSLKERYRTK